MKNCCETAEKHFAGVHLVDGILAVLIDYEVDCPTQGFRFPLVPHGAKLEGCHVGGDVHRPGNEPAEQVF